MEAFPEIECLSIIWLDLDECHQGKIFQWKYYKFEIRNRHRYLLTILAGILSSFSMILINPGTLTGWPYPRLNLKNYQHNISWQKFWINMFSMILLLTCTWKGISIHMGRLKFWWKKVILNHPTNNECTSLHIRLECNQNSPWSRQRCHQHTWNLYQVDPHLCKMWANKYKAKTITHATTCALVII